MMTGMVEEQIRRFACRFSKQERVEGPRNNIVKIGEKDDPKEADKHVQDTCVDKGTSGGTKEALQRMVG